MSIRVVPVKTSLVANSEVGGPRDGKRDPENDYMDLVPVLSADPSIDIPKSSFSQSLAEQSFQEVAEVRAAYRSKTPKLAQAAASAERTAAEKVTEKASTSSEIVDGGEWREIHAPIGPMTAASIVGDGSNNGRIDKPMDGMMIADPIKRESAWRDLGKRLYEGQPAFMERGKQRWNGRVEYDHRSNKVNWNGKPLPNSSLFNSTFDHTKGRPKLGQCILVLMEKNESKIIVRMLESIIKDIDGFIILDTGSTDGTEQLMWDFLVTKHKKLGAIYKTDWYDFGTNRTITVQLAHDVGDWLLLMDADYRLERENKVMPQFWKSRLPSLANNPPAWLLLKTTGDLDYARPHLVLGSVLWCYVCRTHEYLSKSIHDKSSANFRQETFSALMIDHIGDGQSKSDKMGRDIVMLLMDAMDDPKSERAAFYLANTLKQIRMIDWALRSYKQAMNLCGWNEEIYMSAKGALECMFQKHPQPSFERMLAMALHGITTNPERVELLSMFVRKVRMTKDWWPKYSHLCSSLMAFVTHNTYPHNQKLFIERTEHEFGIWQEASICSYYNPAYYEFGLHMSHKVVSVPAFKQQAISVQQQNERNKALYDQKLNDWRRRGVRMTVPVRRYLMEQGHRAMAMQKFSKAREWYQYILHNLVVADLLPEELIDRAEDRTMIDNLCDNLSTQTFHKAHRLTAWQNAKCLHGVITDLDQDRALASFQIGQCQNKLDPDNRILTCVYYVDALKFVPGYPPALAALYELTLFKSSDFTRCVMYLIRLVSMSPMVTVSAPLFKNLKNTMENLVCDQSEWSHTITMKHLPGTPWILPIIPPERKEEQRRGEWNFLPWMNILN